MVTEQVVATNRRRTATGLVLILGYVTLLSWTVENTSYSVWGAVLVTPGLLLVSWPILARAMRQEPDPFIRQLLVSALLLKLASAIARWAVAFIVYDGVADAATYHEQGAMLAAQFVQLDFTFELEGDRDLVGTGFMYVVTGVIYAFTGATLIGGYLVYSWLGFWGLYMLYRAFRIAVPEADHRRYALLLFLMPSMLFWPSGLGKEAWMTFCLGFLALGAAKLFARQHGALLLLALGVVGTALVRPHVTALAFVGIFAGYLLRRDPIRSPTTPVVKGAGVALLLVTGLVLAARAADFFGTDSLSPEAVGEVLAETQEQTNTGGAAFTATPVNSARDLPQATMSVLFRPFPWEAHNGQAFATAVEGSCLLVLTLLSLPRLRRLHRQMRDYPYIALAIMFTLLFIYAFSTFGNFAIIARERVMVYPFVLALLALPLPGPASGRRVAA